MPAKPAGSWADPVLAPIVLVRGPERYLRERAIAGVIDLARAQDPQTEVIAVAGPGYTTGQFDNAASPSLFAEPKVVVVNGTEGANAALDEDLIDYLGNPDPDVVVIIEHGGGLRGKRLLDAVRKAGAPVLEAAELKYERDQSAFVTGELKRLKRRAEPAAVAAIVAAIGGDAGELAAAVAQLCADSSGTITAATVDEYYGGKQTASGFDVADAAVAGDVGGAVTLLRHALADGAQPVALLGALAYKLRTLAKVAALSEGTNVTESGQVTAKDLGLAPFMINQAKPALRNLGSAALGRAIVAVAAADYGIKSGKLDGAFAIEQAVLAIAQRR